MRIIGYTDRITECECCGKTNLKGTFVMIDEETGEDYYYGSSCAFKAFGINEKVMWSEVKANIKNKIQSILPEWFESQKGKSYSFAAEQDFLKTKGLYGVRYGKGKFEIITQFI